MKIGQLVMLIRTQGDLPPTGATGQIHEECCMNFAVRVLFAQHKNQFGEDGAYCVRKSWLVPIDDHKGDIAKEDQQELDLGNGEKLTEADLVKLGKRMLEDLEKEDA
jgi:hypothetical protein